jgi:hypothetical protein
VVQLAPSRSARDVYAGNTVPHGSVSRIFFKLSVHFQGHLIPTSSCCRDKLWPRTYKQWPLLGPSTLWLSLYCCSLWDYGCSILIFKHFLQTRDKGSSLSPTICYLQLYLRRAQERELNLVFPCSCLGKEIERLICVDICKQRSMTAANNRITREFYFQYIWGDERELSWICKKNQ